MLKDKIKYKEHQDKAIKLVEKLEKHIKDRRYDISCFTYNRDRLFEIALDAARKGQLDENYTKERRIEFLYTFEDLYLHLFDIDYLTMQNALESNIEEMKRRLKNHEKELFEESLSDVEPDSDVEYETHMKALYERVENKYGKKDFKK